MENQQRKKKKLSKKIKTSVRENLYVPVDLLIDIFSRIPAKSIARFRCLSKFWASVLRRHDFTELYMTRSSTRPVILFGFRIRDKLYFYSSPQDPNSDEISSTVATPYNTSFPEYTPWFESQTMLCGLVLLRGCWATNVRVICNPATGEFIILPNESTRVTMVRICIGYDPINKQFKVLCMTFSDTHTILTLETGKRLWRTVESKFDLQYGKLINSEVCIKGVLYFVARWKESCKIVCFDVRSEEFSHINIDIDMLKEGAHATTLINYKDKFGVYQRKTYDEFDFDLWVLDDVGNHKWSKHIYRFASNWNKIIRKQTPTRVVGFMTGTNELVFAPYSLSNPFYLIYYNLERKTFRKVMIQGFEKFESCIVHTFLYYSENVKLFK